MATNSLIFNFLARDRASRTFDRLSGKASKLGGAMRRLGQVAKITGLVAAAGLAVVGKAAVDWESAWAGVQKTVDGTAKEMAVLEKQLRELARELPATHTQIARVAEIAGQLGVRRKDVAAFTKTMIDLGVSTNLSATSAAKAIARFSNIMGTSISDVDRLGSVLVELGNNSATTEQEILEMGVRMAAAGKIAGLTEADVLAFASTMSSVGVKAAAGGTAMQKVFININEAVLKGGKELRIFAEVAGVTAEEFARKFRQDPAAAVAAFIIGLGRMNKQGEATSEVLGDVGLGTIRTTRALLSTATAGDLLTKQLGLADQAWKENNALTEEAARRYGTAESKIRTAIGSLKDFAISIGQVVLPVIAEVATAIGNLADSWDIGDKLVPVGEAAARAIREDVIPAIRDAWNGVKALLFGETITVGQGVSGKIVTRDMGGGLFGQASQFVSDIVDALVRAFRTGDFGPLGEAIGKAVGNAVGKFAKLGAEFISWIASIDWIGVGIKAGAALIPFAIGLVTGFVNGLDPTTLIPQIAQHWQEILFAAVSIAFAPAKLIRWIANALRKIPFVGTFLGWLIESFAALSRAVFRPIARFLGRFFGTFINGLTGGAAGRVIAAIGRFLGLIPTAIGVAAISVVQAAGRLIGRLANALISGAGRVGAAIGRVIEFITRPFRGAASWLFGHGMSIIRGLLRGIASVARTIGGWFNSNVIRPIRGAFGGAISWLFRGGRNVILGLLRGIGSLAKTIGGWFNRNVIRPIRGAFSGAIGWLFGGGRNVIFGLLRGIASVARAIGGWLLRNVIRPALAAFTNARNWLFARGRQFLGGLLRGIVSIARTIGGWLLRNVIRPALAAFRNARDWLFRRGRQFVGGLLSGIFSIAKSIARWQFNNVIRPALAAFNNARNWLFRRGKQFVFGLLRGIISIAKSIGRWLRRNVINPAIRTFRNIRNWLFSHGRRFIFGLMDGINDIIRGIRRWLRRHVFNPITNFFNNIRNWLVTEGKDLLRGLRDGALDMLRSPINFFKSIGNKIIEGVKDFFKIGSPSRVFEGFGGDMIRGLVKGLILSAKGLPALIGKVFGGMSGAFRALIDSGFLNPKPAWFDTIATGAIDILADLGFFGNTRGAKMFRSARGRRFVFPLPPGTFSIGQGLGAGRGHQGQDLPAPIGTPVYAPFSGIISRRVVRGSYGRHLRIRGGPWEFLAAHLSAFARTGRIVKKGQLVGFVGSTGNSTGPHLHAEIRHGGRLLSPLSVLPAFAKGGRLGAGQLAMVGEQGPELVKFDQPAQVFSNRETGSILAAGGGEPPIVYVRVFLGDEELTDKVNVQIDNRIDERNRMLKRRSSGHKTGRAR